MDDNSIIETRLSAGKRTYFFDVKEGPKGGRYLKLSEVSTRNGKEERSRIFVFEDHAKEFVQTLEEAMEHVYKKSANDPPLNNPPS